MKKPLFILFFSACAFVSSAQNANFDSIENVVNSIVRAKWTPNEKIDIKRSNRKIVVKQSNKNTIIKRKIRPYKNKEYVYLIDSCNIIHAYYFHNKLEYCRWSIYENNISWLTSDLIFVREKVITITKDNKKRILHYLP